MDCRLLICLHGAQKLETRLHTLQHLNLVSLARHVIASGISSLPFTKVGMFKNVAQNLT